MWTRTIRLYRDAYRGLPREAWVLALAEFINRCGFMVLVFLNIYLTRRLGFSLVRAGQILSAFGLGSIFGGYLGGHLCDRVGIRRIQIGSLVISGLVLIGAGYASTFVPILILLFFYGVVSSAIFPANDSAMTKFCAGDMLTKGFALRRLAANFGITFGPVIGGFLILIDYRWLFWADGLTTLGSAVIIAAFMKPVPVAAAGDKAGAVRSPWRDGPYLAFMGLLLVLMIVFSQLFSTFNLYLNTAYGFPENKIGPLWAVNTILIVLVEMVLIHKLKNRPAIPMVALGGILISLGFALLPFGRGFAYASLTVVIWTMGEILSMPFASTIAASRAGDAVGRYMGMYSLMFSTAMLIAPFAGNWLYAKIGGDAFWPLAGAVGALASAGILTLRKSLGFIRSRPGGRP